LDAVRLDCVNLTVPQRPTVFLIAASRVSLLSGENITLLCREYGA
jgi:hypothetical protein